MGWASGVGEGRGRPQLFGLSSSLGERRQLGGAALEHRLVTGQSCRLELVGTQGCLLGLSGLTTGVAITVPQTTYTLNDGSVEALGSQGAYGAPA